MYIHTCALTFGPPTIFPFQFVPPHDVTENDHKFHIVTMWSLRAINEPHLPFPSASPSPPLSKPTIPNTITKTSSLLGRYRGHNLRQILPAKPPSSSMALPPDQFSALKHAAMAAKQTAYCPYSNFRVGAALLLSDTRTLITGANVENAAYPAGTCAERVALGKAVTWVGEAEETAMGEGVRETVRQSVRKGGILALGVATDVTPPASPCGMCRQL